MNLTLMKDGKEQIFTAPFIPARVLRTVMEMQTRLDLNNLSVEEADEIVGLICAAFGNQFTVDEYWDGVDSEDFNDNLFEFFMRVNGSRKAERERKKKEEETAGK